MKPDGTIELGERGAPARAQTDAGVAEGRINEDVARGKPMVSRGAWAAGKARGTGAFLAIVLQFGLLVLVVELWHVENVAVSRVMQLAFFGFIVHHLLPARFRLAFFALLSMAITIVVAGEIGPKTLTGGMTGKIPWDDFVYHLIPGGTLILIGLGLIGICHLPIHFGLRITLLVASGTGLAVMRANSAWFPDIRGIWMILGSMFAFRLLIYMYDMKNRTAPFGPMRSLAYFFMLPNVCFPLFPVVDYKSFCSTYYNEDWQRIYQTGLQWMLRGIFQLLLYQVVYLFAPLDLATLSSSLGVAGFVLSTYLLYLHVSGQFHLIVGLLHMFGFNLPETHHLFLLASSFTDFWRRINIYWKDFMMRLFFYPVFFRLRQLGTLPALALATIVTFFITWLLHSWQWFWIRGSFLVTWQDISFWVILGLLVLVNALYEATRGRKRKLKSSKVTFRERLVLGLKTIGTFTVICLLWTLWSCKSAEELQTLADAASNPTFREVAIVFAVLAAIGVAGMLWGRSSRDSAEGRPTEAARGAFHFWRVAGAVGAGAACLLCLPAVAPAIPGARDIVDRVRHDVFNARDMDLQRRGYYEELDVARGNTWLARLAEEPEGWLEGRKVFYKERSDFMLSDVAPSVVTKMAGAPVTTNRLGMRDREYQVEKPANTYRMLLLGASHDQGTGVKDDETYENRVEDRLNGERPGSGESRFEILNLSVGGHCMLQRLLRLEQSGFALEPDAVVFSVAASDQRFLVQHLTKVLTLRIGLPPE